MARRPQPPPVTRYGIQLLGGENRFDIGRARRELGFARRWASPKASGAAWSGIARPPGRLESGGSEHERVLVTGGNGFVGRNRPALQDRGDTVRVLALPAEDTHWLGERGVAVCQGRYA